jgi:hypothetical protein
MKYFAPQYAFFLNSEDRYDPELPLLKNQSHGGTMIMWKNELDAFITVYPVTTTSYLPVIYSPPGAPVSVHIALYLPTSGQETEFIEQITLLRITIEELQEKYPGCLIYLRGDSNANINNRNRYNIFMSFLTYFNFSSTSTSHKTYHHFFGQGLFDSRIDVIVQPLTSTPQERIDNVLCSKQYPEIDSHHDIIVSSVVIPTVDVPADDPHLVTAPRVVNTRQKIIWSDENLPEYQTLVSSRLAQIRKDWSIPDSATSVSILLKLTNDLLSQAAATTNKAIPLNTLHEKKSPGIPYEIKKAKNKLKRAHAEHKQANPVHKKDASDNLHNAKKGYRLVVRRQNHFEDLVRDSQLFTMISGNSSPLHRKIRSSKMSSSASVPARTSKIYL